MLKEDKELGYPERSIAENILLEAERLNPGPWVNHSRYVARCAEAIALSESVYDDYDLLIQLCDSISTAEGVVNICERMTDIKMRYGSYPQAKWDKNLELLEYFGKKTGHDIYALCKN